MEAAATVVAPITAPPPPPPSAAAAAATVAVAVDAAAAPIDIPIPETSTATDVAAASYKRQPIVLIKLGGSAITNKAVLHTLAAEAIAALMTQLHAVHRADIKFVLVHGAGSFGHFEARQYGLSTGLAHPEAAVGIGKTRAAVCRLNAEIVRLQVARNTHVSRVYAVVPQVQQLNVHGIPAVGLSPYHNWRTAGRKNVVQGGLQQVLDTLAVGCVPVLHGDVVLDDIQGVSILSGDVIIPWLARQLQPQRVVFVSDVEGVLTKPPSEPGAALVPLCRVTPVADGLATVATTSSLHDVTGGILAKCDSAVQIVRDGVEAGTTVSVIGATSGSLVPVCLGDGLEQLQSCHGTHFIWHALLPSDK